MRNKKIVKKFVIVSPHQDSGGSLVLHQLCKILMEKGFDAKIFYMDHGPYQKEFILKSWLRWIYYEIKSLVMHIVVNIFKTMHTRKYTGYLYTPVKGCKKKYFPIVNKNTVVVYPECVYGNFLNAKKVVRWLLYFNPYTKYDAYGKDDLVIAYREQFNDAVLNPSGRKMRVMSFDFDLYKQTNFGKRSGKCYIVRKGKERKDLPTHFDGVVIDDLLETEIVKVFNECKYCYSYDTQTFYSTIAAICGCISVVVVEEGKERKDYLSHDDQVWGVAYGDSKEEIEFAIRTRKKCLERFDNLSKSNNDNVDYFIEECEKFFK